MTLDGKIATATGDSRWVSGPASRQIVHQLRGRVDAILVGSGTAMADDPLLTARPPGPRKATRIVFDGAAQLAPDSQLVGTCLEAPVLVAVGPQASDERVATLRQRGCEVLRCLGPSHSQRLEQLLDELGRRRMTNVLVEGGGRMFGLLLDARQIDEVHALVAPKLIGGQGPGPIAGVGLPKMGQAIELADRQWEQVGDDLYLYGRVVWRP